MVHGLTSRLAILLLPLAFLSPIRRVPQTRAVKKKSPSYATQTRINAHGHTFWQLFRSKVPLATLLPVTSSLEQAYNPAHWTHSPHHLYTLVYAYFIQDLKICPTFRTYAPNS
jgi:hypothetical protein